jgi:hypothetical protein
MRALARYTRPDEYAHRPSSKGYFFNAQHILNRTVIHNIKTYGTPFPLEKDLPQETILYRINAFINEHPTILFTRNHISQRDGTLKVRPVYAVDDLFLTLESMLTFPLMTEMRKPTSCLMYGLETIRGSNVYLDRLAQSGRFLSFFTIDWSGFDQHLPFTIIKTFYHTFLPMLLVINAGYQPTHDYPNTDMPESDMAQRLINLLTFLYLWFTNMTFLSADGYAFRRLLAGVCSGLFNTQLLDSYGNIFLLIDGMIEYGFTDAVISSIILFVLGDDNSGFTYLSISELEEFILWFEAYSKRRWNMTLSKSKSVITVLRHKIETLGYTCNFGKPTRDIGKLVAQLCYPEHEIKYKTMSARAIGMAYASCGQDVTFHDFCRDVYFTFLPYSEITQDNIVQMQNYLPSYFKMFDDLTLIINFTEFPTLLSIQRLVSRYHGPLQYAPKWNFNHFINAPDVVPPSSKTLFEYMNENDLSFPDHITLPPV